MLDCTPLNPRDHMTGTMKLWERLNLEALIPHFHGLRWSPAVEVDGFAVFVRAVSCVQTPLSAGLNVRCLLFAVHLHDSLSARAIGGSARRALWSGTFAWEFGAASPNRKNIDAARTPKPLAASSIRLRI